MSTTNVTAGEVMDWMAVLMNDAAKASYTYAAMLPYLNMAVAKLLEELERNNVPATDETAEYITVLAGQTKVMPSGSAEGPHYPSDLVDIRKLSERLLGTSDTFIIMNPQNFLNERALTTALIDYSWRGQEIKFIGATTDREIKLDYVREIVHTVNDEKGIIGVINSKSYLAFKGAALCAEFIDENMERAQVLEGEAEKSLDNILGIAAKGQQKITTRRRPFRAGMKNRRWI